MRRELREGLQKLMLPGYSEAQKQNLKTEIRLLIKRPLDLKNHPGYEDTALLISDLFESVSNGMRISSPEPDLLQINEDSLLIDWKHFICCVYAFYNDDNGGFQDHGRTIHSRHPLKKLYRILQPLSEGRVPEDEMPLTAGQRHFLGNLVEYPQHLIKDFIELKEPLEENLEDIFTGSSLLLLRDMVHYDKQMALSFTLWCLEKIQYRGFSPSRFLGGMKPLLGAAESYRMIALSTMDSQKELSLLYWLKCLLERWHEEERDKIEIECFLGLCGALGPMVLSRFENNEEFMRILSDNIELVIEEIALVYPELSPPPGAIGSVRRTLRHWESLLPLNPDNQPGDFQNESHTTEGLQLELF